MTTCRTCKMPVEGNFCTHCGTPVEGPNTQQYTTDSFGANTQNVYVNNVYTRYVSGKNRTVTLLLLIFFGLFGAHRFYVGKIGTGILYLFTGGLCGIGLLVDFIMLLTGSFTDGNGMPVTEWNT